MRKNQTGLTIKWQKKQQTKHGKIETNGEKPTIIGRWQKNTKKKLRKKQTKNGKKLKQMPKN